MHHKDTLHTHIVPFRDCVKFWNFILIHISCCVCLVDDHTHTKIFFLRTYKFIVHFKSSPLKSIYLKYWKIVCLLCTYTIFYVSMFWHHKNNFWAFGRVCNLTAGHVCSKKTNIQKKQIFKKNQKNSKFLIFVFLKFDFACLMHANHK